MVVFPIHNSLRQHYKMLDYTNTYDFKEKNGLFYVPGWLELAKQIYGKDDPRCDYVGGLYEKNKINPSPMEPYYIDENVYKELGNGHEFSTFFQCTQKLKMLTMIHSCVSRCLWLSYINDRWLYGFTTLCPPEPSSFLHS